MKELGADETIDYLTTDFTRSGATYDIVFDAVGKLSYFASRRALAPNGIYVSTDLGRFWVNPLIGLASRWLPIRKKGFLPVPPYSQANTDLMKEIWETGRYTAVIDRTYPLDRILEATKYVESGEKIGNVVMIVR
jgi:NADPH:quinone reductase-like Zn-dependent oxidoreductase